MYIYTHTIQYDVPTDAHGYLVQNVDTLFAMAMHVSQIKPLKPPARQAQMVQMCLVIVLNIVKNVATCFFHKADG